MHAKGCGLVAACFPYLSPMDAGSVTLAAVSQGGSCSLKALEMRRWAKELKSLNCGYKWKRGEVEMFSTEVVEKPKCLEMFWAQRKQIAYDPIAHPDLLYAEIWPKIIFEELHRAGERQRCKISWLVAWCAGGEKESQSLMPGSKSFGEEMLQGECTQIEVQHTLYTSDIQQWPSQGCSPARYMRQCRSHLCLPLSPQRST